MGHNFRRGGVITVNYPDFQIDTLIYIFTIFAADLVKKRALNEKIIGGFPDNVRSCTVFFSFGRGTDQKR